MLHQKHWMVNVNLMHEMISHLLSIPFVEGGSLQAMSFSGECLALSSLGKLRLYNPRTGLLIRKSDWDLHFVLISPCNRFVAGVARNGSQLQVQELKTGKILYETKRVVVSFRHTPFTFSNDWLFFSIEDGILVGVNLLHPSEQITSDGKSANGPFVIETLVDLGNGNLGMIGYVGQGERSDFLAIPIARLVSDPSLGFTSFAYPQTDYLTSEVCVIAPFGDSQVLLYKDYGDSEIDIEGGEFNGFSIQTLSEGGWIALQAYYAENVMRGNALLATQTCFVLGRRDGIDIISRIAPFRVQHLPTLYDTTSFFRTPFYAFNQETNEIAILMEEQVSIFRTK